MYIKLLENIKFDILYTNYIFKSQSSKTQLVSNYFENNSNKLENNYEQQHM